MFFIQMDEIFLHVKIKRDFFYEVLFTGSYQQLIFTCCRTFPTSVNKTSICPNGRKRRSFELYMVGRVSATIILSYCRYLLPLFHFRQVPFKNLSAVLYYRQSIPIDFPLKRNMFPFLPTSRLRNATSMEYWQGEQFKATAWCLRSQTEYRKLHTWRFLQTSTMFRLLSDTHNCEALGLRIPCICSDSCTNTGFQTKVVKTSLSWGSEPFAKTWKL